MMVYAIICGTAYFVCRNYYRRDYDGVRNHLHPRNQLSSGQDTWTQGLCERGEHRARSDTAQRERVQFLTEQHGYIRMW